MSRLVNTGLAPGPWDFSTAGRVQTKLILTGWLAFVLAVTPSRASGIAQDAVAIDLTPSCTACSVEVEPLVAMSMEDQAVGPLLNVQAAALDAAGNIWLAYGNQAPIQRFDSSGAVLDTPRRIGEGPGEFVSPTALLPISDSMVVFDQVQSRATVMTVDFEAVRTRSIPPGTIRSVEVVDWPVVVVNAVFSSPMQAGHPYHLLDLETGEVEGSFGGIGSGDFSAMTRYRLNGHVTVDPQRRVIWTSAREMLRLERWSLDGERLASFSASPDWFPELDRPPRLGSPDVPPDPLVTSLQFADDEVWLTLRLAGDNWQDAWEALEGRTDGPHGRSASTLPDMNRLYKGRVLLIDPDAGSLLTMEELGVSATGGALRGGSGIYAFTNTAGLLPGLRIERYRLANR